MERWSPSSMARAGTLSQRRRRRPPKLTPARAEARGAQQGFRQAAPVERRQSRRPAVEEDSFIAALRLAEPSGDRGRDRATVVVAPPRALGELRRHYHRALAEKIVAEIDKDLDGRPRPS